MPENHDDLADHDSTAAGSMTLTGNFWLRIGTLCLLYVAQGLPFGFVTMALKNYLHGQGASVAETGGMIAMVSWPWALKFLWGPVIDRFGIASMGRRRPWLILAQSGAAITLFVLACTPGLDENITVLGWSILLVNIFLSLQDVAADALAIDLLSDHERGKANGFMYGSSYLGTFLGGGVIGYFLTRDGGSVQSAFFMLGIFITIILLVPLFLRERPGEKLLPWTAGASQLADDDRGANSLRALFTNLLSAFGRPSAIFAAIYALLVYIAVGMLPIVGSEYFVKNLGWPDEAYTNIESLAVWLALLGSIAGGFIADRIGAKRAVFFSGSLLAVLWVAFSLTTFLWAQTWFVTAFLFTEAALTGFMAVSSFSMFMGIADKRVAATQFTAYMSILNLSTGIGGRFAGWVSNLSLDISSIYLVAGCFHLTIMIFVLVCIRPQNAPRKSTETN